MINTCCVLPISILCLYDLLYNQFGYTICLIGQIYLSKAFHQIDRIKQFFHLEL